MGILFFLFYLAQIMLISPINRQNMKRVFLIIFLFTTLAVVAQKDANTLDWLTNIEEAQKLSKKQNKTILVYFTGSDWCAPCKMLKEDFFSSTEFKQKADNFILVIIDYPRRIDILPEKQMEYNRKVMNKYNKEKTFPNVVMLNSNGKELGNLSGYSSLRDTSNHFAFLEKYR